MLKKHLAALLILASCASMAIGQTADSIFLGTRWNVPGPKNAAKSVPLGGTFGPGEADWSIMAAGIAPGADNHPGVSFDFDDLLPFGATGEPAGTAAALFQQALQIWSDASKTPGIPGSGIKITMPAVNDGDGFVGQGAPDPPANPGDGRFGDIRAGVFPFPNLVPSSKPEYEVIAHGFYPDTDAQKLFYPFNASVGGDVHFRQHFSIGQNGVDWVNWKPADPLPPANKVDLLTVMIHEVGHAIGLGHSMIADPDNPPNGIKPSDPTSVMVPVYPGVRRELSAQDIANVRLLYRPTVVPEPSTAAMAMLLCLCGGFSRIRSRR